MKSNSILNDILSIQVPPMINPYINHEIFIARCGRQWTVFLNLSLYNSVG